MPSGTNHLPFLPSGRNARVLPSTQDAKRIPCANMEEGLPRKPGKEQKRHHFYGTARGRRSHMAGTELLGAPITFFPGLRDQVCSALAHDLRDVEWTVGLARNGDGTEHSLGFQLQKEVPGVKRSTSFSAATPHLYRLRIQGKAENTDDLHSVAPDTTSPLWHFPWLLKVSPSPPLFSHLLPSSPGVPPSGYM